MARNILDFFPSPLDFLDSLTLIGLRAGTSIMDIYGEGDFSVSLKSDRSPVTCADLASDRIIVAGLRELCPDIPVISEESEFSSIGSGDGLFFLVDPLDGTKEFIKRNGEFTVNIGLIYGRAPVAGFIYAPALGRIFRGFSGFGVWESRIDGWIGGGDDFDARCGLLWRRLDLGASRPISARPIIVASHSRRALPDRFSFLGDVVETSNAEIVNMGSSLKFCLLASGEADYYPRLHRTMEWDTAAGHAILQCCGGDVVSLDGGLFSYGKVDMAYSNPSFIACRRRR